MPGNLLPGTKIEEDAPGARALPTESGSEPVEIMEYVGLKGGGMVSSSVLSV